jgi:hypothetical protein
LKKDGSKAGTGGKRSVVRIAALCSLNGRNRHIAVEVVSQKPTQTVGDVLTGHGKRAAFSSQTELKTSESTQTVKKFQLDSRGVDLEE